MTRANREKIMYARWKISHRIEKNESIFKNEYVAGDDVRKNGYFVVSDHVFFALIEKIASH